MKLLNIDLEIKYNHFKTHVLRRYVLHKCVVYRPLDTYCK